MEMVRGAAGAVGNGFSRAVDAAGNALGFGTATGVSNPAYDNEAENMEVSGATRTHVTAPGADPPPAYSDSTAFTIKSGSSLAPSAPLAEGTTPSIPSSMSTNATENGIVKSEFLKKIGITHYGKVGREKFATDAKSKMNLVVIPMFTGFCTSVLYAIGIGIDKTGSDKIKKARNIHHVEQGINRFSSWFILLAIALCSDYSRHHRFPFSHSINSCKNAIAVAFIVAVFLTLALFIIDKVNHEKFHNKTINNITHFIFSIPGNVLLAPVTVPVVALGCAHQRGMIGKSDETAK